ncbi:hypothetical protein MASR2M44_21320 [Bacteroidota bacterium]
MVVEKGFKQTEIGMIPEDWGVKRIIDISSLKSGLTITANNISEIGDYSCYGGNGLRGFTKKFTHDGKYPIIGRQGALCGNINYVEGKFFASEHAVVVTVNNQTDAKWLSYVMIRMNLNQYSESSAQPGLSVNKIGILKIPFPLKKNEQTAIANALSDMDALIAQTERLIEKKKAIKQGVMQELLKPKEGWVTKKLGELVDKVTTGKLDANAMKPDGEYRFYTCAKEYYLIDRYSFDDEALLISGNGANVGYIHYYKGKFNAYQRTYVLIGFQIDVSFLKIYLDKHLADRITTEVSAGNTPYIKMDTITEMVVQYPLASNEQSVISNQINDINKEIELIETKLQKLKHQKQGMMQALLTGKIRLI